MQVDEVPRVGLDVCDDTARRKRCDKSINVSLVFLSVTILEAKFAVWCFGVAIAIVDDILDKLLRSHL